MGRVQGSELMKKVIFALAAACTFIAAPALAEDATPTAAAHAGHFTTADTPIGDLLNNDAAKAVLQAHIPDLVNNPQFEMARPMTLKAIQAYAPTLTDDILASIDADLANIH
jgi:para-nitrobenzyl esterase